MNCNQIVLTLVIYRCEIIPLPFVIAVFRRVSASPLNCLDSIIIKNSLSLGILSINPRTPMTKNILKMSDKPSYQTFKINTTEVGYCVDILTIYHVSLYSQSAAAVTAEA